MTPPAWPRAVLIAIAVVACAGDGDRARDGTTDPSIITLAGGGPQGRSFKEVSLYGKILTENLGDAVVNGVIGKGGVGGNIKRIAAGAIQGGRIFEFDLDNAHANREQFAEGDYRNVLLWMKLGTHLFRVIASVEVQRFSDLRGMTVAIGLRGSGDDVLARRILAGYGVDSSNTRFQYIARADAQAALANGQIRAIAYAYARNNKGHLAPVFAARRLGEEIDFVPPDDDKTATFLAGHPTFFVDSLGEPEFDRPHLVGIGFYQGMAISGDLSERMVYRMTRTLYEHWDEVLRNIPWWRGEANLESAAAITTVPYHPGAALYFREQGVWERYHGRP